MIAPIVADYYWSEDDYLESQRLHWRALVRRPFRYLLHFIFGLVLVAGLWGLYKGTDLSSSTTAIFVGAYILFLRKVEFNYFARQRFRKRSDRNKRVKWEFSPDSIEVKVEDVGESKLLWSAFEKAVHTKNGILIYSNGGIYYWMPNRAVQAPFAMDDLWGLLKEKNIECQTVS